MEKLAICRGMGIQIHDIDEGKWRPNLVLSYSFFRNGMVKWSPKGTYLVTRRSDFIFIYKAEGTLIPTICFYHSRVRHVDFSPLEKYLVSYGSFGDKVDLKIFDVKTGVLLREFTGCVRDFLGLGVHRISDITLPLIRWSADEKYFALIEKTILSIYADDALVAHPLTSMKNVIDFCWSPTDNVIALLHYDDSTGDTQLSIVNVPEGNDVCNKRLKGVGHFKIYWHQQGKYVACTFKSLGEIKSMDTGILILEVGRQKAPYLSASLGKTCSGLSFSFEPQGSRFAVIFGGKQDAIIRIMELDSIKCNLPHTPLLGVQATALYWSPIGGLIVFSGCEDFLLYDASKIKILVKKKYTPIAVEWSPSGRFVATYGIDNLIAVWRSSGKFMYRIPADITVGDKRWPQLLWCPPLCSLNHRGDWWEDNAISFSKSCQMADACRKQKLKKMNEPKLVSVDDKLEENKELIEKDLYPISVDDNDGAPLIQHRALQLSFFSRLIDKVRNIWYFFVIKLGRG